MKCKKSDTVGWAQRRTEFLNKSTHLSSMDLSVPETTGRNVLNFHATPAVQVHFNPTDRIMLALCCVCLLTVLSR